MNLSSKKCVPCEGNTAPMNTSGIVKYMLELDKHWHACPTEQSFGRVLRDMKIQREFEFKDFKEAMLFVNKVAEIAEEEQHHPDITINYNKVKIELWTHAVGGLSENDFILAYKIDHEIS